jgi:hypothetical protein
MTMRRPSRRTWRLLALAAQQRANAAPWAAIAHLVGRRERTCRRWPDKYREAWDHLYAAAEIRVLEAAAAEAAVVLRAQRATTVRKAGLAGALNVFAERWRSRKR